MSGRTRLVDALLWTLSAALLILIVVTSLGPAPPTGSFRLADKLEHASAYTGLTVSLLFVLVWRPGTVLRPQPTRWRAGIVALAALALGAALEVGQAFTGRDADWRDVAADAIGVAAAALAWRLLRWAAEHRKD